jgi:hypothetical protein
VRLACFAAVAGPFVAIKVSPDAARVLEGMLAFAGVRSRIWSDPTDLVALGVLPFAWRVSALLEARVVERVPRLVHMLGAMLGGVACIATSEDESWRYETSAFLVSMARESVTVEVSRVTAALDCADLDASVTALGASDFEPTFCASFAPMERLPLDRDFVGGKGDVLHGPGEEEPPCDAVLLGTSGLAPTIVFWQKSPTAKNTLPELNPAAVYLEQAGSSLYLAGSKIMHVRTLEGPVPDIDCSSLETPEGIE